MAKTKEEFDPKFGNPNLAEPNEYADLIHAADKYGRMPASDDTEEMGDLPQGDTPEEAPSPDTEEAPESLDLTAAPSGNPQMSKLQDYMQQYRKLQDQQKKSDLVTGLATAGAQIGQAMAGKYSGNFVPDKTGLDVLSKQAERPMQSFEQGLAVEKAGYGLNAERAATDPNSPQSQMVRNYIKERLHITLAPTVSAADAQLLLKTVGKPVQTKFQKVNGTWTNPKTGETTTVSAAFDPSTHQYISADTGEPLPGFVSEGLNPFTTTVNPNTGQRERFNKSRGTTSNIGTGQAPVGQAESAQEVNASLDPVTRKELNDKIVPNFNKLTEKTQQRLMHQAPIMAKLDEAQLNPAAYAQLQAELARFDVGDQRLAQQEFNMFATRHGYSGWADWLQAHSTGTISEDFATDFAHTINNTVKGMKEDLNNQAEKQAGLLVNRLPPGQRVDPKLVAPLIYSGYTPPQAAETNGMVQVVSAKTGASFMLPKEKVQEALKKNLIKPPQEQPSAEYDNATSPALPAEEPEEETEE